MASDTYPNIVPLSVSEDAFSTFTENEINIPNSFITRTAMLIHQIEMHMSLPEDSPIADAQEQTQVMLTTQPMGAMARTNTDYVIGFWEKSVRSGVAVYLPMVLDHSEGLPTVYTLPKDRPLIIVSDKIYLYIVSTNSSVAAYCHGRMLVTFKTLNEKEWREAFETWAPT